MVKLDLIMERGRGKADEPMEIVEGIRNRGSRDPLPPWKCSPTLSVPSQLGMSSSWILPELGTRDIRLGFDTRALLT